MLQSERIAALSQPLMEAVVPRILSIKKPFDAHVHGRAGDLLRAVAPFTARQFWGAIFEPNLDPPVTTRERARAYRAEIARACAEYPDFRSYLLAYVTDTLDAHELAAGLADDTFIGAKFYPRGATTNSDSGILDVSSFWTPGTRPYDLARVIAESDRGVLQLHCELNYSLSGEELDPYYKEPYFFQEVMPRLLDAHPDVRWSCEHLTCEEGASFLYKNGGPTLGCSITPHHLLYDRRDMFRGGLRPHLFCLPVLKAADHRRALIELATSGKPYVWAGTDSAPHDRRKKECDCCSGGVFTAHAAVELYAHAFDAAGALEDVSCFERFLSVNGPAFYSLPLASDTVSLVREDWTVDEMVRYSEDARDLVLPHGYHQNPNERMVIRWRYA